MLMYNLNVIICYMVIYLGHKDMTFLDKETKRKEKTYPILVKWGKILSRYYIHQLDKKLGEGKILKF